MTRKNDKQILKIIQRHKMITESELAKRLRYKRNALHDRLNRMVMKGKINYTSRDGMRKYYIDEVRIILPEPPELEIKGAEAKFKV